MGSPSLLPFHRESSGRYAGVVVVRLEQAGKPVVVLDLPLIQRLEATLKEVQRGATGLVLASASERVFVAGADLKAISEWDDAQLTKYLEYAARVFAMLPSMPFPTCAAINGAALGGGLEIAMHCDGLVGAQPAAGAKPYSVGLPEAGLGLCPGWGGTNMLPARMGAGDAIRRTASGQTYTFDEARAGGLFDAVAPGAGELIETAMGWVRSAAARGRAERDGAPLRWIGRPGTAPDVLASIDAVKLDVPATESARAVIGAVEAGLGKGWEAALQVERKELVRLRHTPEARSKLEAFFAKSNK